MCECVESLLGQIQGFSHFVSLHVAYSACQRLICLGYPASTPVVQCSQKVTSCLAPQVVCFFFQILTIDLKRV